MPELHVSGRVDSARRLDDLMQAFNSEGHDPTFLCLDVENTPFMTYMWDRGDEAFSAVVLTNPYDDLAGQGCEECGVVRHPWSLDQVKYPITILAVGGYTEVLPADFDRETVEKWLTK